MNKTYYRPLLIFLLLTLTSSISCDTPDEQQSSPPKQKTPVTQSEGKPAKPTYDKDLRATPADTNIYNHKKDLWGWHTGEYIVLKWDPYEYSFFHVYKKTGEDGKWAPAYSGEISKNEFFERGTRDYNVISFKVEAVGRDGSVLYIYEPLTFYLDD